MSEKPLPISVCRLLPVSTTPLPLTLTLLPLSLTSDTAARRISCLPPVRLHSQGYDSLDYENCKEATSYQNFPISSLKPPFNGATAHRLGAVGMARGTCRLAMPGPEPLDKHSDKRR